jgi:hypothetical protein
MPMEGGRLAEHVTGDRLLQVHFSVWHLRRRRDIATRYSEASQVQFGIHAKAPHYAWTWEHPNRRGRTKEEGEKPRTTSLPGPEP